MKSISFKSLSVFAFSALALLATSCSPDEPSNEKEHHLHEEPVKAVCILEEGTLKPGKQFEDNPRAADFVLLPGSEQRMEWESVEGEGWKVVSTEKNFKVKNKQAANSVVYRIRLEYFDDHGHSMNHEFYEEGQDKIHQHFFTMGIYGAPIIDKEQLYFEYTSA